MPKVTIVDQHGHSTEITTKSNIDDPVLEGTMIPEFEILKGLRAERKQKRMDEYNKRKGEITAIPYVVDFQEKQPWDISLRKILADGSKSTTIHYYPTTRKWVVHHKVYHGTFDEFLNFVRRYD